MNYKVKCYVEMAVFIAMLIAPFIAFVWIAINSRSFIVGMVSFLLGN